MEFKRAFVKKVAGTMEDRRRKLTPEQYEQIKQFHAAGYSQLYLSERFGVSITCISYILFPERDKKRFRKKQTTEPGNE